MGSAGNGYIWVMRGSYLAIGLVVLMLQLLPLQTAPRGWAGPDLLLALTMVWVARRPDLAPIWAVVLLFLLADFLLQRPPGLWALCAFVATEALRARADDMRDMIFAAEWAIVGVIMTIMTLALMALWSLLVPFAISNSLLLLQLALTILSYPLLAGLSASVLGVTKAAPGQTDNLGRKL